VFRYKKESKKSKIRGLVAMLTVTPAR